MREEFEKLPQIAEILKGLDATIIWFSETENRYFSDFINFGYNVTELNGAWLAYQAQQQKIDELEARLKKAYDLLEIQENKTSSARVLCETACELLDGYSHQDAMVVLNDLEQALRGEE